MTTQEKIAAIIAGRPVATIDVDPVTGQPVDTVHCSRMSAIAPFEAHELARLIAEALQETN